MMPPITADIHDLIRAMPHGAHLELGALTSAVPTVRRWGRVVMSGWDLLAGHWGAYRTATGKVTWALLAP
jgi:hypothetical protein